MGGFCHDWGDPEQNAREERWARWDESDPGWRDRPSHFEREQNAREERIRAEHAAHHARQRARDLLASEGWGPDEARLKTEVARLKTEVARLNGELETERFARSQLDAELAVRCPPGVTASDWGIYCAARSARGRDRVLYADDYEDWRAGYPAPMTDAIVRVELALAASSAAP